MGLTQKIVVLTALPTSSGADYCSLCVNVCTPVTLFVSTIVPCHPSPCINGGTCSDYGTTLHCSCSETYIGAYCESTRKVSYHVVTHTCIHTLCFCLMCSLTG